MSSKKFLILSIFSICLILNWLSLLAQQLESNTINYKNTCKADYWCIDCGEQKADWQYKSSLTYYIKERLNAAKIENIFGVISVSIIVYENGDVCCQTFTNNTYNTDKEILDLGIDTIINNMPKWSNAVLEGKPYNSIVSLNLYLNIENRNAFEVEIYRMPDINWEETK